MIELRLWRSFIVLAEELNFRRAAERLRITQPALTKQIQELENRLDLQLFRREARGVEPTEATIACLESVRTFLERAQALEDQFSAARRSAETPVRLGLLEYFSRSFLPAALQKVREEFPSARVSIVEVNTTEAAAAVADGRIDLGLAIAPVTEQSVVAKSFRRGAWQLVMPQGHRLAAKTLLSLSEIGQEPLIFFLRRLNPLIFDEIAGAIERAGQRPDIVYQAQDPMIGVELAGNGIGLFVTVSYAIDRLPEGLVWRPIEGLGSAPMLDLVWRRDRMTPVLRALIDAFSEIPQEAVGPAD